jgi:hypothetical protein
VWFAAAGILAFVFFAVGYFSPMPGDEDEDYFFDDVEGDEYTDNYRYDRTTDGYTEGQTDGYTEGQTDGYTEGLSTDDLGYDPSTDDHADQGTDDLAARDQSTEVDEVGGAHRRDAIPVGNASKQAPDETSP